MSMMIDKCEIIIGEIGGDRLRSKVYISDYHKYNYNVVPVDEDICKAFANTPLSSGLAIIIEELLELRRRLERLEAPQRTSTSEIVP